MVGDGRRYRAGRAADAQRRPRRHRRNRAAGRRPQRSQGARARGAERRRANTALLRLIAKAVGVPPRDVTLSAGATARIKRLTITGEPPTLIAALEKIAAKG
jgi:hypothetical protein